MNQKCVLFITALGLFYFPCVFGQSADASLSAYSFAGGHSSQTNLTISMRTGSASWIYIESPFSGEGVVLESIKKNGTVDVAATRDSALFLKRISNTAWIIQRGNLLAVRFNDPLKNGDRCTLSLVLGVPVESSNSDTAIKKADRKLNITIAETASSARVPLSLPKSITIEKRNKP